MSTRLLYAFSAATYLAGLGLIWWKLGWVVTLAIFLMAWAVNLEQRAKRQESQQ